MNLFFDTSALVKYFHLEVGTEQVTTLIQTWQKKIGNLLQQMVFYAVWRDVNIFLYTKSPSELAKNP